MRDRLVFANPDALGASFMVVVYVVIAVAVVALVALAVSVRNTLVALSVDKSSASTDGDRVRS